MASAPRIRRISSQKELETMIDDYITQGYEVITQGENSTLLRKKSWGSAGGHVIVALITVWFTFGVGNAIYAAYAHNSAEQIMLRLEIPETSHNRIA
jgi:hypothetical protein